MASMPRAQQLAAVQDPQYPGGCLRQGRGGKSTTAVNLALALQKRARVALLDADIYGPSIPTT